MTVLEPRKPSSRESLQLAESLFDIQALYECKGSPSHVAAAIPETGFGTNDADAVQAVDLPNRAWSIFDRRPRCAISSFVIACEFPSRPSQIPTPFSATNLDLQPQKLAILLSWSRHCLCGVTTFLQQRVLVIINNFVRPAPLSPRALCRLILRFRWCILCPRFPTPSSNPNYDAPILPPNERGLSILAPWLACPLLQ